MYSLWQNVKNAYFSLTGLNISRLLLAVMLWSVASTGMALSLGRSQGAAFLGRPLDISIRAVLDDSESPSDACVRADVFYSDTRIDSSRVRVSIEKTGTAQEAVIRVRTSAVVDEPVVTLYVRAICARTVERRYVLLADPVPEPAPAAPAAALSQPAPTRERPAADPPAIDTPLALAGTVKKPAASRTRPQPVQAAGTAAPAAPRASLRAAVKPAARLKLEPLDLMIEVSPQLKLSSEMVSLPATSAEQRTLAAAMWKALTTDAADVLADTGKMNLMEADLRRLKVEAKSSQASLAELRVQLAQQREAQGWLYALLAALALSAAAFLFWRRWYAKRDLRARASPWWRRKKAPPANWFASEIGGDAGFTEDSRSLDSEPFWLARSGPTGAVKAKNPLQAASPVSSGFSPALPRSDDQADFALSMPYMPRAVKAEELFDVQQQAEFFMSVGQHDQAVAVLRNHISEDVQTSALVYLDLLNLYHQLKRRSDFDLLRLEFNRMFNTKVPSFDLYTGTSLGLEAYEAALSRIVSLWPTPKVLEVIEESVFRKPGDRGEAFDLEAYRELLFLYGIAKEIVQAQPEPEPEPQPAASEILLNFDFLSSLTPAATGSTQPAESQQGFASSTDLQPLSMESGGARLAASADTRFLPVLDIDLDALEEAPLTVIEASVRK